MSVMEVIGMIVRMQDMYKEVKMTEENKKAEEKKKSNEVPLTDKEKIKKRIIELESEIQMHENKLNQANQVVQIESKQLVAKMGAIEEFRKLL